MPDAWRTSTTHPLPFDLVPSPGWVGRLGLTHLPGKRGEAYDERHWRYLETDAARLRDIHGVETLVLLVEDTELRWWGAQALIHTLDALGVRLLRHPIVDARVPTDLPRFQELLASVGAGLHAGQTIGIACVGGYGRTGTVAAAVLMRAGVPAAEAMRIVRNARPGTIAFPEQEEFLLSGPATR